MWNDDPGSSASCVQGHGLGLLVEPSGPALRQHLRTSGQSDAPATHQPARGRAWAPQPQGCRKRRSSGPGREPRSRPCSSCGSRLYSGASPCLCDRAPHPPAAHPCRRRRPSHRRHSWQPPIRSDGSIPGRRQHNASVFGRCSSAWASSSPHWFRGLRPARDARIFQPAARASADGLGVGPAACRVACARSTALRQWLGAPFLRAVAPWTQYSPSAGACARGNTISRACSARGGPVAVAVCPSGIALARSPEVAYAFVRTLLDCGPAGHRAGREGPSTGTSPRCPHLPHRLVCRNAQAPVARQRHLAIVGDEDPTRS